MTSRHKIDLILSAQVKKADTIKAVSQSIGELSDAIERQADAARKGEGSLDGIKAAYRDLEALAQRIRDGVDLANRFERNSAAIKKTSEAVDRAKAKFDAYTASLRNVQTLTDAQVERQRVLNASYQNQQTKLRDLQSTHAELGAALKASGIDASNLAGYYGRVEQEAKDLSIAFAKAASAQDRYNANLKEFNAEAQEAARVAKLFEAAAARADKRIAEQAARHTAYDEQQASLRGAAAAQARLDEETRQAAASYKSAAASAAVFTAELEKQERLAGFSRIADKADATAQAMNSLTRASKTLGEPFRSFVETIKDIQNPAAAGRKTLDGLEAQFRAVAAVARASEPDVRSLQAAIRGLEGVQASVGSKAGLIDHYKKLQAELREARSAYADAGKEIARISGLLRTEAGASNENVEALRQAQAAHRQAALTIRERNTALDRSRQALREAGIDVRNLVAAEERLATVSRQARQETESLTNSLRKIGHEARNVEGSPLFFRKPGIGVFELIRREVVGATAGVIGLYGALNLANSAIEALAEKEATRNKIAVAIDSNDQAAIGKEIEYVRQQADYFGKGINSLADSYASYSISAKSAGYTSEQNRYTFEKLTAGMTVLGMSSDQSGRAFAQLNQILGKTKPELEDLNTIAESGFAGFRGLMARGLRYIGVEGIRAGSEIQDMSKMMKKGLIDSQTAVFATARAIEVEFGDRIPAAIQSTRAEQGRFETAITDFKVAIAEGGFAEEFIKALKTIREFLASPPGQDFAKSLSSVFGDIAKAVVFVITNIDTLKTILMTIGGIFALNLGRNQAIGLLQLGEEFGKAGKAANGFQKAMVGVRLAFLGLNAALAGIMLAKWAYDNIAAVRLGLQLFIAGWDLALTTVKSAILVWASDIPRFFSNLWIRIKNTAKEGVAGFATVLADMAKAAGWESTGNSLEAFASRVKGTLEKTADQPSLLTQALIDEGERQKKVIHATAEDIKREYDLIQKGLLDAQGRPIVKPGEGKTPPTPTPIPGRPTGGLGKGDKDEKELKKQQALAKEIEDQLNNIQARTEKAKTETLETRMQGIDSQYRNLRDKIDELANPKIRAAAIARLDKYTALLKDQLKETTNEALAKEYEANLTAVENFERRVAAKQTESVEERVAAVQKSYEQLFRKLEDDRKQYALVGRDQAEIDSLQKRAAAANEVLKVEERQKAQIAHITKLQQDQTAAIDQRRNRIDEINEAEASGAMSSAEAYAERNRVIAESQPLIEQASQAVINYAIALRNEGTITQAVFEAIIAKAENAKNSARGLSEMIVIQGRDIERMIASGATDAFADMASSIAAATKGTKSWRDAINDVGAAAAEFAAQFLKDLARMIIQTAILNSLRGMSFGGAAAGDYTSAAMGYSYHKGGLVGRGGRRVTMPSEVWDNAPRYHSGGVVGLAADEYPTILQRNEEVLAKDSPRNVLNVKPNASSAGTRFVLVDDRAKVPEAMSSAEGEQVIVQAIKRNIVSVRRMVNS